MTLTIDRFLPMKPNIVLSDWTADISGYEWRPLAGEEPNRFHRLMQSMVLGIRWRKL